MKTNNKLFKQELIKKVMNPKRLEDIYEKYNTELEYYDFIDLYG
jgi:hypothetical protein